MEILLEFLIDLAFEGALEASTNKKVPAWVRYPLVGLIGLFFAAIIGLLLLAGVLMLRQIWFVGLLFIVLGILFAFLTVRKFRKVYMEKREKWN